MRQTFTTTLIILIIILINTWQPGSIPRFWHTGIHFLNWWPTLWLGTSILIIPPTPPPNLSLSSLSFVLMFTGFFYDPTLLSKRCIIPSLFFTLECHRFFFCLVLIPFTLAVYPSPVIGWHVVCLFRDTIIIWVIYVSSRLTIIPLATSRSIIPPACPGSALRSPPSWPLLWPTSPNHLSWLHWMWRTSWDPLKPSPAPLQKQQSREYLRFTRSLPTSHEAPNVNRPADSELCSLAYLCFFTTGR